MERIRLDLTKQHLNSRKINQFDDRVIGIDLFEDDIEYNVDNAYIVLNMVNSKNQAITQTDKITKKGNCIDIELMEEATRVEGVLIMQLVINQNNKQKSTFEFNMMIHPSILNGAELGATIVIDSIKLLSDKIIEATQLIQDNEDLIVSGKVATKDDINKVNEQLDSKVSHIKLRNSIKLDLPCYDGGNQGVHPKVVFKESGWNGYKYWMAYTPFTNSDDMKENPSILASNDGIDWVVPTGLVNPIDTAPSYPRFFSDTHLLINENNVMECWYRQLYKDEVPEKEMIWRKTSTDGVNWSNAELLHKVETSNRGSLLSPAIIRENGKYKIYCLELMPSIGCRLKLYESTTGNNWTLVKSFDDFKIDITGYNMWHLDVEKTDKGYEMLVSSNMPVAELFYSSSLDGLSWTPFVKFMERGASGSFDEGRLYRSCILRDSRGYKVYYSAFDRSDKCGIGLISCTTNNIFDVVGLQYSDTMSKSNLITKKMPNLETTGISKLGQFGYLLQEGLKMLRSGIAHCIIRPAKVKGVDGVEIVDVNDNPINFTAKSIVATATVETPSITTGNTVIDTTNIKLVKAGVTQSYQSCGATGGELIASNTNGVDGNGIYTAKYFRFLTTGDEGQITLEKGNTTLGRPTVILMKDIDGTSYKVPTVRYIPTTQRPADPYNGFSYFDTTLGKKVYRHAGKWVDALGTQV